MRHVSFLALFLLACAKPAQSPPPASAATAESAPEPSREAAETRTVAGDKTLRPATGGETDESPYLGVLDRAGLVTIVEQGLGRVLARLKLSPVLTRGKFQGFRVNAIDPAWSGSGVQVNDVVVRLNGQTIERPEQALVAFESLRVASEMALELVRGSEKIALRYRIE